MVTTPIHDQLMTDEAFQIDKIGKEMWEKRAPHLQELGKIEKIIRELTPLPCSYDVSRLQPDYFLEFTYTELLGCMWLQPQSNEMNAQMVQQALTDDVSRWAFQPFDDLPLRDKYVLGKPLCLVHDRPIETKPKTVIFLPGHNVFDEAVSAEGLMRLMHEDKDAFIKLHPITAPELTRKLGQTFGYHRIFDRDCSGVELLNLAETVYITTATEMGLQAMIMNKPVKNLTRYHYEGRGSFTAFYRLLLNKPPAEAKRTLKQLLNSPLSGFLHPNDPELQEKIVYYFATAMRLREGRRRLVEEFMPDRYRDFVMSHSRHGLPSIAGPVHKPATPKT
jgi:hypothetical protein